MESDLLKVLLLGSKVSPYSLWDWSRNPGIYKRWKPPLFTVALAHSCHQAQTEHGVEPAGKEAWLSNTGW